MPVLVSDYELKEQYDKSSQAILTLLEILCPQAGKPPMCMRN